MIQTRNNYDLGVINGAIGFVSEIGTMRGALKVRFHDDEVSYTTETVGELALAYALTIHRSQGSEYPLRRPRGSQVTRAS